VLSGKKILLGVCGSIAAYKAAYFVRLLKKENAEVKVIMTASAFDFITPLTLATLSKNSVLSKFIANDEGDWNNHVVLGLWADLFIIAPASANTLAKMASGICDNLLLATYLSARCPVFVAPAMDLDMYQHSATQANLSTLKNQNVTIIDPNSGELASGLSGPGRMAEPEDLLERAKGFFLINQPLEGKTVLVTAGPTYEKIDPVRFIGNHSSGKMGIAIARQFHLLGAKVKLILGPVAEKVHDQGIDVENVTSANDMHEAANQAFEHSDIAVLAAAVADYMPVVAKDSKIKKSGKDLNLELTQTPDIAASLGTKKSNGQFIVGFALETDNELENAGKKLHSKNFDLIVLNSLQNKGAGFGHDTNKISILDRDNNCLEFELKSKQEVAKDIINAILDKISK
jgi:phosphopantothenoylcysteine decarboxylase/phosphopantothenate--cysteine ligase